MALQYFDRLSANAGSPCYLHIIHKLFAGPVLLCDIAFFNLTII